MATKYMSSTGEISIEKTPSVYIEWKVPYTILLSKKTGREINSPWFDFEEVIWHLSASIVESSIRGYHGNYGVIDLCLVRRHRPPSTTSIHYSIGIKQKDGKAFESKEGRYYFKRGEERLTEYGFIGRLDVIHQMINLAPNGVVTFFCCILMEKMELSQENESEEKTIESEEDCESEENSQEKDCKDDDLKQELHKLGENESEEETTESEEDSESEENYHEKDCKDDNLKQELHKLRGLKKLGTDFKESFLSGEDTDVTIKVKNKEFKAHKYILRTRSPVFYSMFAHDMKEKNSGTVDITDCEPDAFEIFLLYLYSGKMENLSINTVFDLFRTADKYDTEELKLKCKRFMVTSLSVDTICCVIEVALQHSETELLKTATEFFAKNLKTIIVTVKWQSFLKKNAVEANELFIQASNYYVLKE